MPNFLEVLDGSGRTPRKIQVEVLTALQENWDKFDIFAITAPTATGKSLISRAIQLQTNGAIITVSNQLVNQFSEDYPRCNVFYGADNYSSASRYDAAKLEACLPQSHTIYNPVSFRIASKQREFEHPSVIILDEAHASMSLLSELTATQLPIKRKEFLKDHLDSPEHAIKFLLDTIAEKRAKQQEKDNVGKRMDARRMESGILKLEDLVEAIKLEPERLAIWLTSVATKYGQKYYWNCKSTSIPRSFLRRYFKDSKVILLSATLFQSDVLELAGDKKFKKIEAESPIPAERRPLYLMPTDVALNYPMDTKAVAAKLDEMLANLPLRPAIIHTTYSNMSSIASHMKTPCLTHDKDTKEEVLNEFLAKGGVLLSAGLTEGVDLKDDLARLNIIVSCRFPNLGSDYVCKKKAQPGGDYWYSLETIKQTIQALGRTTRNENDYSVSVILDGRFAGLYRKTKDELPQSFKECIVWQSVTYTDIMQNISKFILDK